MTKFWTNLIIIVTVLAVSLPSLSAQPSAKGDFFSFGSTKHGKAKHFQYLLSGTASDKSAKNDKVQAQKIALDSIVGVRQMGGVPPTNHYFMKLELAFNAKGLDLTRTEYSNENNIGQRVWEKEYRFEFKYDNKDRIIEYWLSAKAEDADEWQLGYKEVIVYESDTKATSQSHYRNTETDEWEEMEKSELVLENDKIKEVTTRWDYGGAYETLEKEVYEYNANGDILQWVNDVFDYETEEWTSESKATYTYEGSRLVQYSYFEWDDMLDGEWIEDERSTYSYEGDVLNEFIEYDYDGDLEDLAPVTKGVLTTDASVNPSDVIHGKALFEEFPIKHKVNLMTQYYYEEDAWVKDAESAFYYSPFNLTSVTETEVSATLLYPNPTSGAVHFAAGEELRGSTIEIYDLAGRKLITQTLNGNASVSLGGLDAGMYIYKLSSAGSVKTGKIIKE